MKKEEVEIFKGKFVRATRKQDNFCMYGYIDDVKETTILMRNKKGQRSLIHYEDLNELMEIEPKH